MNYGMKNKIKFLFSATVLGLVFWAGTTDGWAQGRSGGAGRGAGSSSSSHPGGLGTASERSGGRSDTGLGTASRRSDGRSDTGLNRAQLMGKNLAQADDVLQQHPNLPDKMKTTAKDLRTGYKIALAVNPYLKFGQFVAANMISRNLNSRYPGLTTTAILNGLANGRNIGQTLKTLGISSSDAKTAERKAKNDLKSDNP